MKFIFRNLRIKVQGTRAQGAMRALKGWDGPLVANRYRRLRLKKPSTVLLGHFDLVLISDDPIVMLDHGSSATAQVSICRSTFISKIF